VVRGSGSEEKARELLASGDGLRISIGNCVNVEVERVEAEQRDLCRCFFIFRSARARACTHKTAIGDSDPIKSALAHFADQTSPEVREVPKPDS
jgi:hypothetical protein